ncbi:MAG TPA: ArsI/CadI family heavy metal resistance metalloenzyme [Gammaproteobacteria bacterium]|nr:ArsI/CadI family heavy metal resistance metalloenzyme [Gammaproteobacteria bacterium]
MKRLHVHVAVADLAKSVQFYSTLFGTAPTVEKPDYAKWMLDDPRVNFAISTRGKRPGLDHLGIQAESREELQEIAARLKAAEVATQDQAATRCCYAESSKTWSADPQGVAWESFYTFGESTTYGEAERADQVQMSPGKPVVEKGGACCAQPGA